MAPELSVIIPVYNGATTIEALVERLRHTLANVLHEVILVNDASLDNSEEICCNLANGNPNILYLSLRRNFGEHNAVMCGLNYARGDFAVIIDDDFQNPPDEILVLHQKAKEGFDVVYAQYQQKMHSLWRNVGSRGNDCLATILLKKPRSLYLSSFKLLRRELITEIIKYKGPFPYIDGLILRATDNIGTVSVRHAPRTCGRSNYTLCRLIKLHCNMLFNFSTAPLKICTFVGLLSFFFGVIFSLMILIEKLINPTLPLGWASLMTGLLVLGGLQMVFLGVIGEYLGKQYLDQNGTPQWVIKKKITHQP